MPPKDTKKKDGTGTNNKAQPPAKGEAKQQTLNIPAKKPAAVQK
jgi:hypothetical protein